MLHRDVAEGVHRIGEHFANWYSLEEGGRLTVVDAGLPASWRSLLGVLEEIGRAPGDIEALAPTHAHFDHIGFAERARAELGIPVWIHENDVPLMERPWLYVSGRSPFAYRRTLPLVASFVRAGALRAGPIRGVRRFADEGTLDLPGSPRVLFTPGHTLGRVALWQVDRDALITGDALVTHDPYTNIRGPNSGSQNHRAWGDGRQRGGTGLARPAGGHGSRDAPARPP